MELFLSLILKSFVQKNRLFGKIETYSMPRYRSFEIDYKEDVEF